MRRFVTLLGMLSRYAPQALAAGVFLGLFLPGLAGILRPWLAPAVWVLLYLAMMRIAWGDLIERIRKPLLLVMIVFWMLIVTPALMALVLSGVEFRPGLEAAMILTAGSSALFSTPALGVMFGLDGALLLIVLVATTLLMPITVPLAAMALLGFDIGADPYAMMGRMSQLVISAALAAVLSRKLIGDARVNAHAPEMDGMAVGLLLVFAIGIMDGVGVRLMADPADVAVVVALSFAVYGGMLVIGAIVFKLLIPGTSRRDALSAGFTSGARNLALILAVLPASVDPDIPLFFAVGQFPIYIMPMILMPIMRRFLR
ncbi:MAG: hypothetical protein NWR87_01705 [Rhodospirillales bacterium]|nr:hypothetical protein [Rhodospirillales bacterium]